MVPTHIGVRSASRSASRQFAARELLGGADQLAVRLAAAGAGNLGKSCARTQRVGKPWRLHIGTAAAFGAYQAALGQCRQRPPHRVPINPIGLGDFGLARQPLARGKAAIGDTALDSVGDLPPKCHAGGRVLYAHRVERPERAIGKIILLSRNSHGASLGSCLIS
jgi:hypothetical protein